MGAIEKLLKVTPKWALLFEWVCLGACFSLAIAPDNLLSLNGIKLVLNLSTLAIMLAVIVTHFHIKHTPYLLISNIHPREIVRVSAGIFLLRAFILHILFITVEDISPLLLLAKNVSYFSLLFLFISFAFSLNPKVQFASTKDGRLSMNYIIQATIYLGIVLLMILAINSESRIILNFLGLIFVSVMSFIIFHITQSLRLGKFLHTRQIASYFLVLIFSLATMIGIANLRIIKTENPIEASLWQAFSTTNLAENKDLDRIYDYLNLNRLPCNTLFPLDFSQYCEISLKRKFLSTKFPNTEHPEFKHLMQTDYSFIQKYGMYYIKSLGIPLNLSELWSQWLIEDADIQELKTLLKKKDVIVSSLTNLMVKATPKRPEIANVLDPEIIIRFADLREVQKTLQFFFNDPKIINDQSRFEIWKAWKKIPDLQGSRKPASP